MVAICDIFLWDLFSMLKLPCHNNSLLKNFIADSLSRRLCSLTCIKIQKKKQNKILLYNYTGMTKSFYLEKRNYNVTNKI